MSKIKYLYWILFILFLFTFCEKKNPVDIPSDPENIDTFDINICSGFENKVYTFSLYSCTEADSLDCYQKVLASVMLPEQYLKCSSTDSLARTCLMYPFLDDIWSPAYNNLQQGFNHIMCIFNGFEELFTRENANIALIRIYREMDPEGVCDFTEYGDQCDYMDQFMSIEITLAQFQLINKLTPQETEMSIEVYLDKYYEKSKIPSYGWVREMSGLVIIGRILYSQHYKPFMDELFTTAWNSVVLLDIIMSGYSEETIQFIISNAENYLEQQKK